MALWPRRLRDKFWPEALPAPGCFLGKMVLVTGATAGLGLAASIHFASLGAVVIVTSRSEAQGNAAKEVIEARADVVGQGKVYFMLLDMGKFSSCVEFIDQLKQSEFRHIGLDVAILNDGLINVNFVKSSDGWYVG